ncbi:coiled-coil domain-containing protein 187 [Microcebus murinus]|uniref:coiled-coil domain-containing protein 187 n=1 Tax=Microcebus murinus TaxID=30608 RepID=UPI003F6B1620
MRLRLPALTAPLPTGDPQTTPCPSSAEEPDGHTWGPPAQRQHSRDRGGPCGPQEASQAAEGATIQVQLGPRLAGSPPAEPQDTESWWSGEQRTEACLQEPGVASARLEDAWLAASPAPAAPKEEEEAPPTVCQSSALPRPPPAGDLGSESPSATCSGSSEAPASSPTSPGGSGSSLSCPSLHGFQKATAILVQLSESPVSLSGLEAEDTGGDEDTPSEEDTPGDGLSWSGELSAQSSWEEPGPPLSWGLLWGEPRQQGAPGGGGQGTRPLYGSSMDVAVSGCLDLERSLPQAGSLLPRPEVPAPGSGSELSEASSKVWDEDSEENLPEPGARSSSLAGGSSGLEDSGEAHVALPALGPGEGQEASGTSDSLTSGSNAGKAKRESPEAACMVFPSETSPLGDLDLSLSFPLGTSASAGVDPGKEGQVQLPQAAAGCRGRPWPAAPSSSTQRKPLQPLPEHEVPVTLQAPPGDPAGLAPLVATGQGPGPGGHGVSPILGEAHAPLAGGVLTEILSPVDEVLSYGSFDLPSSAHADVPLPPLPPTPQAESDSEDGRPGSEDFPSPPQEAAFPGAPLGAQGEDTSVTTEDLSSLSGDGLPETLSPRPQESGLRRGAAGQGRSLEDELGEAGALVGREAAGSQWSTPVGWPGRLQEGPGSVPGGLPGPSAPPSREACVAGEGLSRLLTAGDTDMLFGIWRGHLEPPLDTGSWVGTGRRGASWEGVESAGCPGGSVQLLVCPDEPLDLDAVSASAVSLGGHTCLAETPLGGQDPRAMLAESRAAAPPDPRPVAPAAPLPGRVPVGASGQAGEGGEGALICEAEAQPGAEASPGMATEGVVDLVSTRLTRRVLRDSLAALSALVLAPREAPGQERRQGQQVKREPVPGWGSTCARTGAGKGPREEQRALGCTLAAWAPEGFAQEVIAMTCMGDWRGCIVCLSERAGGSANPSLAEVPSSTATLARGYPSGHCGFCFCVEGRSRPPNRGELPLPESTCFPRNTHPGGKLRSRRGCRQEEDFLWGQKSPEVSL